MGLFNLKQSKREAKICDIDAELEVESIKKETHASIQQANKATKNLKSLLDANGITLNISIATGGHNHGR